MKFRYNKHGTPIMNNPNWNCKYYHELVSQKKSDSQPFPICTNPLVAFEADKTGSMLLYCPRPCKYEKEMNDNLFILHYIRKEITERSKNGLIEFLVSDIKKEVGKKRNKLEHFAYCMRYFGYKDIKKDKDKILFSLNKNGDSDD